MIAAVSMVKDEADVIAATLWHLSQQGVDRIYLYENASTDGTWEIVRDLRDGPLAELLTVYPDEEPGYYQSRKMTELARTAHADGADWIVPFDADELWTAPGGLAAFLEGMPKDVGLVRFPLYNHYRTAIDGGGHPFRAMQWRSLEPLKLPKVAVRASANVRIEAGNHDASGYRGVSLNLLQPDGPVAMIHHYPYRSSEQFIRKARNGSAAYAATDLPRSTGQHWREWGDVLREHGEAGLRAWYNDAFTFAEPVAGGLVLDPIALEEHA